MTSQPLVASVCVDYLSHPLSTEHLLVCYQQITRQVAHAPQSAKDAAKSFQHQSQTLLHLLGQHQILEVPKAKERPAPVGCQSQLRRMQNALWRRSSQSSLAKDVGLVRPESLNWQKECDVLWLYGPLYEVDVVQLEQPHPQPKTSEWLQEAQDSYHRQLGRAHLAAAAAVFDSPPEFPGVEISDALETTSEASTVVEQDATAISTIPSSSSSSSSSPSSPSMSSSSPSISPLSLSSSSSSSTEEPPMADTTAYSTSSTTATSHPDSPPSTESSMAPIPDTGLTPAAAKDTLVKPTDTISPTDSTTLIRPHKSALKQQRTKMQLFEELRAFTHSPEYLTLANFLAAAHAATPSSLTCTAGLDGTRSEPISPISNEASSPFVLPGFSASTKYHFRSHDRRRASFPKSASHPNRLNINVNVNLNTSTHGGFVSSKQLRFSLEVQELVFLPTSPPFRISRAKPTRAHSDPAVQTTAHSSFIAPTHHSAWPPNPSLLQRQQYYHSGHQGRGSISTATASIPSYMDTTGAKVQATDPSYSKTMASKRYMEKDEDDSLLDCHLNDDFDDEYLFANCRDDDDEDARYDDDDGDVIHGIGSAGSRFRLASKSTIVARRPKEVDPHQAGPGVLWQVYTAVTGVKELIACAFVEQLKWMFTSSYYQELSRKPLCPGKNPKDDIMNDLIQLMVDLKNYDSKKVKDPIAYWEQCIGLGIFLRSIAMEHLAGSWDGYWRAASNYQMYNNPVTGEWIWIPIDFDDTFGTYYDGKVESYLNMSKKSKKGFETPMVYKLIIETPEINARFEKILKDIVQYAFKPQALMPRIDAYNKMIYYGTALCLGYRSFRRYHRRSKVRLDYQELD